MSGMTRLARWLGAFALLLGGSVAACSDDGGAPGAPGTDAGAKDVAAATDGTAAADASTDAATDASAGAVADAGSSQ